MTSKALVIALVGTGCVGAAGLGAYLAVQSSAVSLAAPTAGQRAEAVAPVRTIAPLPEHLALAPPPAQTVPRHAAEAGQAQTPTAQRPSAATPSGPASPAATTVQSRALSQDPQIDGGVVGASGDPQVAPVPDTPTQPAFDERTIPADAVIGIRLETPISSETSRVEDQVIARVVREVKVEGQIAIPAGARLEGFVTTVERGGKLRDRSRIGLRFAVLVVGDSRLPIQTEAIFREGESPANEASSKIGASAVVGSILGAVLGGKRGAVVGSVAGAAGGTAAVMAGGRNEASLPVGTPLTVRLTAPVTVLTAHEE